MRAYDPTPLSTSPPDQGADMCTFMWVLVVPSGRAVRLHHGRLHGVQCTMRNARVSVIDPVNVPLFSESGGGLSC